MKEKRYEAAYAGFVYEAPATHWTPSTVVRQRLTKMDFTKPDGIELGGMLLATSAMSTTITLPRHTPTKAGTSKRPPLRITVGPKASSWILQPTAPITTCTGIMCWQNLRIR